MVIESTVDLPPEFGQDTDIDVNGETIAVLIEMLFELLFFL